MQHHGVSFDHVVYAHFTPVMHRRDDHPSKELLINETNPKLLTGW